MKRLLKTPELVLAGIVVVLAGIVTAFNRDFLTLGNGLDLLKSYSFLGILALGVLVVLVSGGIDISFTATASVAQYVMATLVISHGGNVPVAFALAAAVGTLLGLVNALFIHVLRIPAIITTIATLNVYNGLLIFFSGGRWIDAMPEWFGDFANRMLFAHAAADGREYGLSVVSAIFLGLAAFTGWLLTKTTLGRSIYALGGSERAARRAGLSLLRVRLFVYGYMGFLAGVAGVVQALLISTVDPSSIVGKELEVLAAVVIGGASLAGGRGSLPGTLLGVTLIAILGNGLTIMRVPARWYNVFIGLTIIISVTVSALRARRRLTRPIDVSDALLSGAEPPAPTVKSPAVTVSRLAS